MKKTSIIESLNSVQNDLHLLVEKFNALRFLHRSPEEIRLTENAIKNKMCFTAIHKITRSTKKAAKKLKLKNADSCGVYSALNQMINKQSKMTKEFDWDKEFPAVGEMKGDLSGIKTKDVTDIMHMRSPKVTQDDIRNVQKLDHNVRLLAEHIKNLASKLKITPNEVWKEITRTNTCSNSRNKIKIDLKPE